MISSEIETSRVDSNNKEVATEASTKYKEYRNSYNNIRSS